MVDVDKTMHTEKSEGNGITLSRTNNKARIF